MMMRMRMRMMMMMIIIIITMIIITMMMMMMLIALKGAVSDFLQSRSSLHREPSPGRNRVQITCNTSNVYHVQHVVLRATWYEGAAQLLCLT